MKDKNNMIISVDVGKAFDNIQHPFMKKKIHQCGSRGSISQHNIGHLWENYSQHHTQWAKTKSFPSEIRNKTRMSTFSTSIQHSIGSPSHSDQTRRRNTRHPNRKVEVKRSFFVDDIVVYIENPIDTTKNLHDLISEFGKAVGYKVNIQKSKAFCTPTMKYQKQKLGEKIPFAIAKRKAKYLLINLTK